MNKTLSVVIAMLSLAMSASAYRRSVSGAGIDGRWEATQTTPKGGLKVTLDLKSDGGNLRGTVTGPTGQRQDIQNGKIDRDSVSFETNALVNGEQLTISWSGTLSGASLNLSRSIAGHEQFQIAPIEAKRVK